MAERIRLTGEVVGRDDVSNEEHAISPEERDAYEEKGFMVVDVGGHTMAIRFTEFADGTIQILPKSSMQGRAASVGGHTNFGYAGYFKGFVYLGGKRKALVDFWELFPNEGHHFATQGDKPDTQRRIAETIAELEGTDVVKVKGGYSFMAARKAAH